MNASVFLTVVFMTASGPGILDGFWPIQMRDMAHCHASSKRLVHYIDTAAADLPVAITQCVLASSELEAIEIMTRRHSRHAQLDPENQENQE